MKIEEIHWGQTVKDNNTGFEFVVVSFGANRDGSNPWVYCDFEGNEGDVWEFTPDELTAI